MSRLSNRTPRVTLFTQFLHILATPSSLGGPASYIDWSRSVRSKPRDQASREPIQLEETHPAARLRRRARPGRGVAPGREEETDVLEIGVGRDVLQGLEAVLDEA